MVNVSVFRSAFDEASPRGGLGQQREPRPPGAVFAADRDWEAFLTAVRQRGFDQMSDKFEPWVYGDVAISELALTPGPPPSDLNPFL